MDIVTTLNLVFREIKRKKYIIQDIKNDLPLQQFCAVKNIYFLNDFRIPHFDVIFQLLLARH